MTSTRNRVVAGIAALAIGGGSATAGYLARGSDDSGASPTAATSTGSAAQPTASTSTLSVNSIYKRARSGVVEVLATQQSSDAPFPSGGGSGSAQAQGSGFVYDTSGHIITNEHVVDGATSVSVRFADGRTQTAQVVGVDESTDLAVLKVASLPSNVTPLRLGSSDALEVGDGVVAI